MGATAGDAHTPVYGYQFRAYFTTYDSAGVPTAVTSPDSEISLDAGTFADCTNEAVPIKEVGGSTDSPNAYLDLTAAEMSAGCVHVQVKSSATATQPVIIYPRVLPASLTGTSQTGGSATTIKLAADAPAYDLCGCWVGVDSGTYAGQVRKISAYNASTKIATVKRAFGGAPDSASYSILVPEAMQSAIATRMMLAMPAYAPNTSGGLPTFGTGAGQLDVTGGAVRARGVQFSGDGPRLFPFDQPWVDFTYRGTDPDTGALTAYAQGLPRLYKLTYGANPSWVSIAADLSTLIDEASGQMLLEFDVSDYDPAMAAGDVYLLLWDQVSYHDGVHAWAGPRLAWVFYCADMKEPAVSLVDGAITAAKIADGALTASKFAAAYVGVVAPVVKDETNTTDRYSCVWLDARDLSIVSPTGATIRVDADGGDNLFPETAMVKDADTGAWYLVKTTSRTVAGVAYKATVVATIGGVAYTAVDLIARDSVV